MFTITEGGSNVDGRILIALAVLSTLQSAHAACTPPDCAPAEGWDNFANNLGSDLAPLLALFGEQVTTQYLSETMDVADCLLFALAPLGIITAMVGAIRVSGSSKLRAIIGRAKETRGDVEADLMSSTSSDVCELWSGEDVVRVIGKPVLLQLVYNETKVHESGPERIFDLKDGILNFQDQATKTTFYKPQPKLLNQDSEKPDSQSPVPPANQGPAQPANQSLLQPTNQDPAPAQSRYSDIENWQARNNPPNLSLNVSIKRITRGRMAIFLIVGFLAQGAVLAFAAVSQYKLRLPKNDSSIPSYAFPVFLLGTVTLAGGVFLCARVVETSTQEKIWEPKNADTTRVVWLQQGGQKVGDQLFESFARLGSQDKVYTSQKGEDGKKERTALAATAVCVTLVGFIAQFFGLRATHSSVIVLQLVAILVMTGLRSYAHARRDKNNDIKEPDVVRGYELDWLAKKLGGCSTWEVMSLSHSDSSDGPVQSETVSKPGENGAPNLPQIEVRENPGLTPATRLVPSEPGNVGAVGGPGANPATEPLQAPRMPQRAMMIRASLTELSIDWVLNSRRCVAVLQRAIEESMNDVFTKMELNKKNCNEPSFQWCIPVTARPEVREGSPSEPAQNCEVSLILERKKDETGSWGEWKAKKEELEAVLCLWASSLTEFDRKQAQNDKVRPKQIRLLGPATLASPLDYKFWIHRGVGLRRTKLNDEHERYFGWRGSLSDEYLCVEADHVDLEALCAQTLYTLFLGRLARWVDGVGGTTTTRRANDSNGGSSTEDNSWKQFHLSNSNFASLAEIFVRCGLGTIEVAYQCIIPAFSSVEKPPYPDSVYTRARKVSKVLSKEEKWKDVIEIDSWLCQNLLPTNAPVSVIHAEVAQRLKEGCKKLLSGIKDDEQHEKLRPVWDFIHTQCQVLSTAKLFDLSFSMVTRCMTYWRFNNHSRASTQEFVELISRTIEFVTGRQDSEIIKKNVWEGWNDKVFDQPESFARFLFNNQRSEEKGGEHFLAYSVLLVRQESGDLFSNEEITRYFNDPESLKVAANTTVNGPFEPLSDDIPIDILLSRKYLSPLQQAASSGKKQLVKRLLDEGAQIDGEPARYRGQTALQAAASDGQQEVVELLLARGADIKAKPASDDGRTALQAAAGAGRLEVVKLLLPGGVNGDPGENEGRTALQAAAEGGHRETVELLMAQGACVDAHPALYFGRTALQAAAGAGHIDIVRLILESKDVINTRAGYYRGRTALQAAAEDGHEEIVELLLTRGAHVDAEPALVDGRTALQAAAGAGHGEVVKQLLRAGANVNARAGESGRTALQAAVEGGHMNTVALLLAADSDINAAPGKADGITVLQAALDQGDPRMMKLILASDYLDVEAILHSASESERGKVFEILKSGEVDWNYKTGVLKGTPLHKAIQHRHDAVFELLVTVCEVNLTDAEGRSPLHLAVWLGNKHAVKWLVKNREVAVNLADYKRSTPIFIAASTGNVDIASLLLESPSLDVNRVSFDGRTPLHIAAKMGHDMVTELLFGRKDLDVNITDIIGSTPLHIASLRGMENLVVRLLSSGGVNVNCCDRGGATPLILAASSGEGAIVRRLLARSDILINVGDLKGCTPLYGAAQGGHEVIVEQLLANGAIVSQRFQGGKTALHAAAIAGYVGIVARLLSADDSEVDAESDKNWTPLSCAAKTGNREIVELLLARGAGVNHITKDGATPLLLAAQMGHDLVVERLLAAPEIKVNLTDNTGATPLHVAAAGGHHSIVGRLLAENMNVNDLDQKRGTPLHLAAAFGHDLVVEKLLMAPGINVNLLNSYDRAPLVIAASLGHNMIVEQLLAWRDIDANGSGVEMPLLAAAANGYPAIVNMLLAKVDVNQQDSSGLSALWLAALGGHDAIVQMLLKRKTANVNLANNNRATPLHVAAQNGHEGVVKMLLARAKIDVNFADLDSVTPLIAAAKKEHVGVVKQLLEHKDININLVDGHGNIIPSHIFKGVVRGLLEKARTTQSVPKST